LTHFSNSRFLYSPSLKKQDQHSPSNVCLAAITDPTSYCAVILGAVLLTEKPPAQPVGTFEAIACKIKSPNSKGRKEVILTMRRYTIRTLSHCFYECKYHVVWTPKYRGKVFQNQYTKDEVDRIIRAVCKWKHWEVFELSVQEDHVHLCVGIEPKTSISYTMAIIKGKTSKWIKKKNKKIATLCHKGSLWATGYFVSTIGADEYIVRRYVKNQDKHHQMEQPSLWSSLIPRG
jgi:putative transposase